MATPTTRIAENGTTVIEVAGRLNVGNNLTTVETAIFEEIRAGKKAVVIDVSKLDYIDSASLGMLIGCSKAATEVGAEIRIAAPQRMVARTMSLIQMDKVIPIDADVPK
ncbi:MAG: STAS domain-containing protein [Bryobacteraceae bacterium]